jgi:competence protein ComEC
MMLRLRALLGLFVTFACVLTLPAQGTAAAGKLRVYFIDAEGGQSTLFVTPAGKSLLIDTGWPDNNFRDADRIVAAAKSAGLSRIDAVLITHFHEDHVGGVPQLVQRIPVGTFFVHGPNRELDHGATEEGYAAFQKVLAQTKEGDRTEARRSTAYPRSGRNCHQLRRKSDPDAASRRRPAQCFLQAE